MVPVGMSGCPWWIETRTLCPPTDAAARRIFSAYRLTIRIGSGVIRRDMIATIRRFAEGKATHTGSLPERSAQVVTE